MTNIPQHQRDAFAHALADKLGEPDGFRVDGEPWQPPTALEGTWYLLLRHDDGRRRRFVATAEVIAPYLHSVTTYGRNVDPDGSRLTPGETAAAIRELLAKTTGLPPVQVTEWASVITVTVHHPDRPGKQVWDVLADAAGAFQTDSHDGHPSTPDVRFGWEPRTPQQIAADRRAEAAFRRARHLEDGDERYDPVAEHLNQWRREMPYEH